MQCSWDTRKIAELGYYKKGRHKLRAESRIQRWCEQVGSDTLGVKLECSPRSAGQHKSLICKHHY